MVIKEEIKHNKNKIIDLNIKHIDVENLIQKEK